MDRHLGLVILRREGFSQPIAGGPVSPGRTDSVLPRPDNTGMAYHVARYPPQVVGCTVPRPGPLRPRSVRRRRSCGCIWAQPLVDPRAVGESGDEALSGG